MYVRTKHLEETTGNLHMPIKLSALTSLAIASTCFFLVGCGGSGENTNDGDTPNVSARAPESGAEDSKAVGSFKYFPQPKPFQEIRFSAKERAQPKSPQEALATMEEMRKLYDSSNVPDPLNQDLSRETVYAVGKAIRLLQLQLPHDIEWLKKLDASAIEGVDNISKQQIANTQTNLLSRLEKYLPKEIDFTLVHTSKFIADSLTPLNQMIVEKAANLDMSDQNAVRNLLGKELLNQSRAQAIQRLAEGFEAAILFDELMQQDNQWPSKRDAFYLLVAKYEKNLGQAAEAISLPKDIGDAGLKSAAEKALARSKIKFEKLVVNAPSRPFSKDHYLVDFDETSVTKSQYRWDEFQVATVEKEGNGYFLYYSTIRKYSEGPKTVPVGEWHVGPRHKSSPISVKSF